jgi:L-fuconolactonase
MKIDSHHHFWKYDPVTYSWMNEKMGVLKKDYQPEDLKAEINSSNIDGVISVQADQSMRETDDLLKHANEHSFIQGVVGWFPLAEPELEGLLERYASNPWLKGVRHVVQDEPDDRFILGDAFNAGIRRLKPHNLVYDILMIEFWEKLLAS